MTTQRMVGRHTRPKKLTPKQNVPIFREEQVDTVNPQDDSLRNQVETGVEKSEESVSHLPVRKSWLIFQ